MIELEVSAPRLDAVAPAAGGSPGRMLREAREAQGMPIDALAASIKVSVRKLESLEADRIDELPDATFARALAQTVCRSLKIDAAPVLALLPAARGHRIEQVSEGLNAPFRDRPARLDAVALGPLLRAAWAPALLLGLAALVYFMPDGSVSGLMTSLRETVRTASHSSNSDPAAAGQGGGAEGVPPPEAVLAPLVAAESSGAAPAPKAAPLFAAAASSATATGLLQLRASAVSWVEVKDARERVLMSRSLQPGETVTLDGVLPMRVKIGNAAVTEVLLRGQRVDIAPMTSENIARVELK